MNGFWDAVGLFGEIGRPIGDEVGVGDGHGDDGERSHDVGEGNRRIGLHRIGERRRPRIHVERRRVDHVARIGEQMNQT